MKLSKGAGSEEQQKKIAIGVFAVLALGVMWYEVKDTLFPDTTVPVAIASQAQAPATSAAPASAAGNAKAAEAPASASLDPTLHMEAMLVSESLEYSGSGRNIFSASSVPTPVTIPTPLAHARPVAPPPPPVPCPPNCPPPPPPPPIPLKFFGVKIAADGSRQACLLQGENVYWASPGDVVMRRYRVITVDAKTIQVEDMQNHNSQTLPLLAN
jgi:hypothetical protein